MSLLRLHLGSRGRLSLLVCEFRLTPATLARPPMTPLCSSHPQSPYLQEGHGHRPQGLPFGGTQLNPQPLPPRTHFWKLKAPKCTGLLSCRVGGLPSGSCGLRPAPCPCPLLWPSGNTALLCQGSPSTLSDPWSQVPAEPSLTPRFGPPTAEGAALGPCLRGGLQAGQGRRAGSQAMDQGGGAPGCGPGP